MSLQYFPLTGRILLDDTGGHVIFDSDDEMLSVLPDDVKTGSQIVPARTAYSSGVDGTQVVVDIEQDYFLAYLDLPGAYVVRGMMRSTWASNPEPADNLWRQASGTHLDIIDGVGLTYVPQTDLVGLNFVASIGGYTLFVNELGHLVLRERIVMRARDPGGPPAQYNRAREQATISFRLLIGFFLGADFSARRGIRYDKTWSGVTSITHDFPFGYAFTGRRCVVVVTSTSASQPSITIGGVAATVHGHVAGGGGSITVASRVVDTGSPLTVVVSGATGYAWAFSASETTTPVVTTATAASASSVSVGINASNAATLVMAMGSVGAASTISWAGADAGTQINWTAATLPRAFAIAPQGSSSTNVTASFGATGALAILAVRFA